MGERICSGPDCNKPARARGMCFTHYGAARKRGEFEPIERKPIQPAGPGERACSRPGCDRRYFSRDLCAYHYGKAWRAKSLPIAVPTLPLDRHSIYRFNAETRLGHCSVCGPNAEIRIRSTGRPECDQKPGRGRLAGSPRRRKRWVVPLTRRQETLRAYNLTEAQFEEMAAQQGGACGICLQVPNKLLNVDHCHTTGRVRGLLCNACNVGLGFFRDDPERMRRAIEYLA